MAKSKVPVQKGEIKVDMNTYKNMPYTARVTERREEVSKLRSGRDMKGKKEK